MARAKGGFKTRRRRKKVLKMAEGMYGRTSGSIRRGSEAVTRALKYAYRDRKQKKREFRGLWIQRINAAVRNLGTSYNGFIQGLKTNSIEIDRRMLADMANTDPSGFEAVYKAAKIS